ncbi:cell envelope integrity protein TolA [Rhizobium puerariae]|uniref:Cell envelope integrity protein TolA n=1 Tax=Rhizobium puerariae TaxID=1585791 RepID=A0ABV6AR31_9HYPH
MSLVVSQAGPGGRVGELALWSVAGLVVLTVHFAAAALLLQETPDMPADSSPPAAIMIELAPEPEAVNTEEDQVSSDLQEQEEVKSEETQPVEEPQPVEQPQPEPEPTPEPVVEQTPEPVAEEPPPEMPEPTPEITETIPEPPPEPVEEIDPIEQQMTAALENVEVPLPMMRPPVAEKPPEEAKKPEPRKEPVKKPQKPKQQQQQARQDMAEAKVQTRQSDRTAASQNSTGFFAQSVSPAKWKSRVQAKLARTARKCPGNGTGTAAVRFSFDGSGNVTGVSLSRSSGDSAIDNYIVSAVRRASPIPAPPSGVASYLDQALTCL